MKKLYFTLLYTLLASAAFAQVDWYNRGVIVTGGEGVSIYLPGDYIDDSPGNLEDDLNMRTLGSMVIKGDIVNLGTTGIFDFDTVLTLNFEGNLRQRIRGNTEVLLGEVVINKTANLLELNQNVQLNKTLTFSRGQVNVTDQVLQFNGLFEGNDTLDIKLIFGESNTDYITGTSGYISYFTNGIQEDFTFSNFGNFGLGFSNGPGLSQFEIRRYFDADYPVANNKNIDRVFWLQRGSPDTLSNFRFHYLNHELDGIAEANLAIYYSIDNGARWVKLNGTVDQGTNIVSAAGRAGVPQDQPALFTLAARDCNVRPGISLRSVAANNIVNDTINICQYDDLLITEPGAADYRYYAWSSAVLDSAVESNILRIDSIDFAQEGWYVLYERNAPGCESIDSVYVNVRDLPIAQFITVPNTLSTNVCFGDSIDFVSTSTVTEGPITVWNWDFNDAGAVSSVENPTHEYSVPGDFIPSLSVVSIYGCASTADATALVEIQTLPVVSFDIIDRFNNIVSETCERDEITLSNNSTYTDLYGDPDTNNTSVWFFPDGTGSTDDSPVYNFPFASAGEVKLIYTNTTTGCTDSTTRPLTIFEKPDGAFITQVEEIDSAEVCQGTFMYFINQTTIGDGTGITYEWLFGDGNRSTEVIPRHVYSVPGPYTVTLISTSVEHPMCVDTISQDILVNPAPVADFGIIDNDICLYETAGFTNLSTISGGTFTSTWNFGNGVDSTTAAALVDYDYALPKRSYTVRLDILSDKGCPANRTRTIDVNPIPVANFFALSQCEGDSLIIINGSEGLFEERLSYVWDFGPFGPAFVTDTAFANPGFGTYTFGLTVTTEYGCVADTTKEVIVERNPAVNLGGSQISCTGSYTIDPAAGSGVFLPPGSRYEWRNFAGILLDTTATLTVTQSDIYRVRVLTPDGCEFVSAVSVNIFNPVELGADQVHCEPVNITAETNNNQLTLADQTSFNWTKDGAFYASTNTITIAETGNYAVSITREAGGRSCIDTDTLFVEIQIDPNLDLGPDQQACIGDSITFAANLSASSYQWVSLATGSVLGTDSTLTVTTAGSYRLDAQIGACTVSDTVAARFNLPPTVSFAPAAASVCLGEAVRLTNFSFAATDSLAADPYRWDLGDGTTTTVQNPQPQYAAAGNYVITLTVTTTSGCTASYQDSVLVKSPPEPGFDVDSVCVGTQLTITNLTIADTGMQYFWDFGDGTTSTDQNPAKTYTLSGNYEIILEVVQDGCSAQLSRQVEIYGEPAIDLGIDITTCGTSFLIDPGPIGTSFTWRDPIADTLLATTQAYLVTTDQQLSLEITNSTGCTARDTVAVTLNTANSIDLGPDTTVCDTYTLDAGFSSSGIYAWSTGETTRTITATSSGTYSVTFTDQNGCTASDQVQVEVLRLPTVDLGADRSLCAGETATLQISNPEGNAVLWSTGATGNQIAVSATGAYGVRVSNASCIVSDTIQVQFNTSPAASISTRDVCFGEVVSFANPDAVAGQTYRWDFGDGTFSPLARPTRQYNNAGNYIVTLQVTDQTTACETTVQSPVAVTALPAPNFVINNGCEDEQRRFENISTNKAQLSFSWNYGNGSGDSIPEGQSLYTEPGNYFVTLQATDAQGCTNSIAREVEVYAKPQVELGDNLLTCDDQVTLNAFNQGSSFRWSDNSITQILQVNRGKSGTYTVRVTNARGCVATDSVAVRFSDKAFPQLGADMSACAEVALDAGVDALQYIWSTGAVDRTITATESGHYWVQAITADRCLATDTIGITIYALPEVSLPNQVEACAGDSILLDATLTDPATEYVWSSGATTGQYYVTESGVYTVDLTSAQGCTFNQTVLATIHPLPEIDLPDALQACDSLLLDAGNRGASFLWSTNETTQRITVRSPDTYRVTVTNGEGCHSTKVVNATITTSPVIELGDDLSTCEGTTATLLPEVVFNATASLSYNWSTGQQDQEIIVGQPGAYQLTVRDENGCTASDQVNLTIDPLPALDLGADLSRCGIEGQEQDQLTLRTGLSGMTHLWGSQVGLSGMADTLAITDDGRYWVTVTSGAGCTASDTLRVSTTNNGIAASFLMPTEVFVGDEVHFVQLTEPEPASFIWDFGNGVTSTRQNPSRRFRDTGEFEISLTVSNGVCTNTLSKTLIVLEPDGEGGNSIDEEPVFFLEVLKAVLYPNPSDGNISFDFEFNRAVEARISIYNLSGRMLQRHVIVAEAYNMDFDLTDLPAGLYLLDLEVPGRIQRFKFIIGQENQ